MSEDMRVEKFAEAIVGGILGDDFEFISLDDSRYPTREELFTEARLWARSLLSVVDPSFKDEGNMVEKLRDSWSESLNMVLSEQVGNKMLSDIIATALSGYEPVEDMDSQSSSSGTPNAELLARVKHQVQDLSDCANLGKTKGVGSLESDFILGYTSIILDLINEMEK